MPIRRIFALLTLPAAALAVSVPRAQAATAQDPYQIFSQARDVWAQQQYPQYLTYTVAVTVSERGVVKCKHYHLADDPDTGQIQVNAVSDEEQAAPPTPEGFVLHLQPRRQGHVIMDRVVGKAGEAVDYLGVPLISPTYDFGMSRHSDASGQRNDDALIAQIRQQYKDPMPAVKAQEVANDGELKSIALVTTHTRDYSVTLAGIENLNGRPCYHLLLQPLHDPQRYRLRQLWIDTQSYRTAQLVTEGNFTDSNVPWMISYGQIGGAQYIVSETALQPVGIGRHMYEHASVSFDGIAPAQVPARPQSWFVTKQNVMEEPGQAGNSP